MVSAEGRKEAIISAASLVGTPLRNLTKCCRGCRTGVFGVSVHCLKGCVCLNNYSRQEEKPASALIVATDEENRGQLGRRSGSHC